ncbi:heme ABC transporter substrate-binding protein IsdE [Viridibacillus arvi]|uniref:heme ABC transporter substrate-binding protein IsdE n=1 Tax=Viridibacillus arvi TaxID=263475 RepID=UPI003D01D10D
MLALFPFLGGCGSEQETVAQGKSSQEDATENRIVATTMSTVEIMDELELDLVGVPETSSKMPERYKDVTVVGGAMSPDVEMIKSLNPTDVLSVTTLEYDLAKGFKEVGLPTTFVDFQSIGDMQSEIIALGKKYEREEQAEKLVAKYTNKLQEIQEQVKDKDSPKVLILLGIPGSYLVATNESYIGNLVEMVGGTNAIQGQKVEFLASNSEYLHESNPDIILRMAHGMPKDVIKMFDEEFKVNDVWKHFSAVKNGRVYDLEEPVFGTTSNLQADIALEKLAEILYEE